MIENTELNKFLEEALELVIKEQPSKLVIARLDSNNAISFSYYNCGYVDLQRAGQEMINEGLMRLLAASEFHMQQLKDELEEDTNED